MSHIALARPRNADTRTQFGRRFSQLVATIEHVLQVRRERRMLAGLSDAMLKDLGLSRADVAAETGRALWDVPAERP